MKSEKKISLKSFIIIAIIVAILIIAIIGISIYILKNRENQENKLQSTTEPEIEVGEPDIATISYEGTFKTRAVVVRPEENLLVVMPTISNDEYRYQEEFIYETESNVELKQGQEVEITFHYNETSEIYIYDAIIENVEILKEESNIKIPQDVIVNAYSSKDNVKISFDSGYINNSGMKFTITDTNEYKYDYDIMEYKLYKYNPPPTTTEVIETEEGMATPGYDPWPKITRINNLSTEQNYTIDGNGQINLEINWSEIYGELEEGQYMLTLSTVSEQRQNPLNTNLLEYPYDTIMIQINFVIRQNSPNGYGEISIY